MLKLGRCRAAREALSLLAVLCLGPLAAGCSNFKQIIGIQPVAPDEFAVESQPPLALPPDFALRPPKPGTARPQQAKSDAEAQHVFVDAAPGKPTNEVMTQELSREAARIAALGSSPSSPGLDSELGKNSLSAKLLDYSGTGGAAVEKRETEELKGIY